MTATENPINRLSFHTIVREKPISRLPIHKVLRNRYLNIHFTASKPRFFFKFNLKVADVHEFLHFIIIFVLHIRFTYILHYCDILNVQIFIDQQEF